MFSLVPFQDILGKNIGENGHLLILIPLFINFLNSEITNTEKIVFNVSGKHMGDFECSEAIGKSHPYM